MRELSIRASIQAGSQLEPRESKAARRKLTFEERRFPRDIIDQQRPSGPSIVALRDAPEARRASDWFPPRHQDNRSARYSEPDTPHPLPPHDDDMYAPSQHCNLIFFPSGPPCPPSLPSGKTVSSFEPNSTPIVGSDVLRKRASVS
jgi:hypothetical protein